MVALQATWAYSNKGRARLYRCNEGSPLSQSYQSMGRTRHRLTVVGVAVYGAVKAFTSYNEAMRNSTQEAKNNRAVAEAQASLAKKVSDATLDERNKVDMLNKVIHSNAYTVDERRQAIAAMQKLVPEYHASISKEGKLYNDNQIAIQNYIKELENAAMAEAIYERKVEINKKKLELKLKESKIRHSLKAVDTERKSHPERYESEAVADAFTGQLIEQNDALKSNEKQKKIHTRRLKENLSLQQQLNAEESYYNTELRKNANLQKLYKKKEKKSLQDESTGTNRTTDSTGHYTTEKERKAAEKEQKKREAAARKAEIKRKADLKKELDDAKKSAEAQQLEATTLYSTGQIRLADTTTAWRRLRSRDFSSAWTSFANTERPRVRSTSV